MIINLKIGESAKISKNIKLKLITVEGALVRLGIDAPRETPVWRAELGPNNPYRSVSK